MTAAYGEKFATLWPTHPITQAELEAARPVLEKMWLAALAQAGGRPISATDPCSLEIVGGFVEPFDAIVAKGLAVRDGDPSTLRRGDVN